MAEALKFPPLPVYEVADAKLVDYYAAYKASVLKRAANRERVYSLGFGEWYVRVFLGKVAA